ncbi:hypothetical protein E4U55_006447 [Claviceps digitariae]|nr:hypothetical protein E4U55_006447 [Claviceps digitariae]
MSTKGNPVESWLDHVQQIIIREDDGDGIEEGTGLEKDRLPRQAQDDEDEGTRIRTAEKQGSDQTAMNPQHSAADCDHDAVGELRHRQQQALVSPGEKQCHYEPAGEGLELVTPVPSDCSGPADKRFDEEFVRKPRRKTRPDRYETRHALASDKAQSHHQNEGDCPRRGRKARLKIRLRSGKEVMNNFTSESICRDSLIMKPCVTENHPHADAHMRGRKAVADLMSYDFDLGHAVRRLPASGRIHPHIRPVSRQVSPQLKEQSRDPSPFVDCESPLRRGGSLSHLEPLVQDMTGHNAAQWPKALNGASSTHGEISTSLKLETRISPRTKAQHRQGGFSGSDTFRPCRHDSAPFRTRNTASMDRSRACIDLGGGHRLDFGRLRNRGLYRADRLPIAGDETTVIANKRASQLQHTRDNPFSRVERLAISARRRAGYSDDERGAADSLRRRFSRRLTSTM